MRAKSKNVLESALKLTYILTLAKMYFKYRNNYKKFTRTPYEICWDIYLIRLSYNAHLYINHISTCRSSSGLKSKIVNTNHVVVVFFFIRYIINFKI